MTTYSLQKGAREARHRLIAQHETGDYEIGNALAAVDAITVLLDRSLTPADREAGHLLAILTPAMQRAVQAVLAATHRGAHRVGRWLKTVNSLTEAVGLAAVQPETPVWVVMTDADWQSGANWSALSLAAAWGLNQLTVITLATGIHNGTAVAKTVPVEPLRAKLAAFNAAVYECDADHYKTLIDGCHFACRDPRPSVLLISAPYGSGLAELEEAGGELLTDNRAARLHELMSRP